MLESGVRSCIMPGLPRYLEQELNVGTVHTTVPTFNSCIKCVGMPGIIYDCTPDCHPVSWAWMRPHVPDLTTARSFDSQATCAIGVLGLFC